MSSDSFALTLPDRRKKDPHRVKALDHRNGVRWLRLKGLFQSFRCLAQFEPA